MPTLADPSRHGMCKGWQVWSCAAVITFLPGQLHRHAWVMYGSLCQVNLLVRAGVRCACCALCQFPLGCDLASLRCHLPSSSLHETVRRTTPSCSQTIGSCSVAASAPRVHGFATCCALCGARALLGSGKWLKRLGLLPPVCTHHAMQPKPTNQYQRQSTDACAVGVSYELSSRTARRGPCTEGGFRESFGARLLWTCQLGLPRKARRSGA